MLTDYYLGETVIGRKEEEVGVTTYLIYHLHSVAIITLLYFPASPLLIVLLLGLCGHFLNRVWAGMINNWRLWWWWG